VHGATQPQARSHPPRRSFRERPLQVEQLRQLLFVHPSGAPLCPWAMGRLHESTLTGGHHDGADNLQPHPDVYPRTTGRSPPGCCARCTAEPPSPDRRSCLSSGRRSRGPSRAALHRHPATSLIGRTPARRTGRRGDRAPARRCRPARAARRLRPNGASSSTPTPSTSPRSKQARSVPTSRRPTIVSATSTPTSPSGRRSWSSPPLSPATAATPTAGPPSRTRRQFNAAAFKRLDVKDGRICHEKYPPPFDELVEYGTRELLCCRYSNPLEIRNRLGELIRHL
jgi:hypothetical protein